VCHRSPETARPVELARRAAKTAICRAGTKLYSYFPQVEFENAGRSGRARFPRLAYRIGVWGLGSGVREETPTLTPDA
jgi:hypothetical protein